MFQRFRRQLGLCCLVLGLALTSSAPAFAQQAVNPDDVLYLMPYWFPFPKASDEAVTAEFADIQRRLGPEGPYVKLGVSVYLHVQMDDWSIDPSNRAAVRAGLTETIRSLDAILDKARRTRVPIALSVLTAIRERYDAVQRASEAEDVRSMQWYADNVVAGGWWTHSRYARKARRIQEAYVRELGAVIANRMRRYPDILVAASGDGEVELAHARENTIYADYSPFVVAEFRDWIRHAGLYAQGAACAGQGHRLGSRYAGDLTPGQDTNGDGHTLNADFGTAFTTWNLLHFDWSLEDAWLSKDARAISQAAYSAAGFNRLPGGTTGGFDAPRTPERGKPWWDLWVEFKQALLQHHNRDFAEWMTTSRDAESGATVPSTRWYSYQIPSDYGYDGSPEHPTERFLSSMSAWWTADVSPYGSPGITAFNLDWGDHVKYTLKRVAPRIAERNLRWGIIEWNPGLLPYDKGVTERLDVYRDEMAVVEQYRPSLLQPFAWGDEINRVQGTGFETALKEMVARLKDGAAPAPRLEIESVADGARLAQPFTISGWAVDLGKIRGPGRGPGIDEVRVEAYRQPRTKGSRPVPLGTVTYGNARADIGAAFGSQFAASGFSLGVKGLTPGRYDLVVMARSTVSADARVSRTIPVEVFGPLKAAPSSLRFSATKAGPGAPMSSPAPQTVTVSHGAQKKPAWTATADRPWLKITNGSGAGPGTFSVSVADPGKLAASASLTGTITVSAPSARTLAIIPVTLTVERAGASSAAPPFGLVETPLLPAAHVTGTIALSGWALDEAGIAAVKVYRNCLPFEPKGNCRTEPAAGASVVLLGDATLVSGARPDIEARYAEFPQAGRAAWGYLLATPLLPNVPGRQMYGGQGPLTLYVIATDIEGTQALLGRTMTSPTTSDGTPTEISLGNDTIATPFGALDTPAPEQTVTGTIANFGWALTPDSDKAAGAGDMMVPPDGSTLRVYVDGVLKGTAAYSQCRGKVAGAVPAGTLCDDDVSNIFGNAAPERPMTPRTVNPTPYRNLDAGRGAIGAYILDTTALANGLHTIVWGVEDSARRVGALGTRYFMVLNAGARDPGGDGQGGDGVAPAPKVEERVAALHAAPARARGASRVLESLEAAAGEVRARTGFDERADYAVLAPGRDGVRRVAISELGRVDLRLGRVESAALVANETLRDMPPGSGLDRASGHFTWAPGPGYLGTYRLIFVRGAARIAVEVTIRPADQK